MLILDSEKKKIKLYKKYKYLCNSEEKLELLPSINKVISMLKLHESNWFGFFFVLGFFLRKEIIILALQPALSYRFVIWGS